MFKLDRKDDFVTQKQLDVMKLELSLMESMYIISSGELREIFTKRGLYKNPIDGKVYSSRDEKENRFPQPCTIVTIGLDNDFSKSGDYDFIISSKGAGFIFNNRDELSFGNKNYGATKIVEKDGVVVHTVGDKLKAAYKLKSILENFHNFSDLVTAEKQWKYTTYYNITDKAFGQTLASYIFLTREEMAQKRLQINEAEQKVIYIDEDRIKRNHDTYMKRIEQIKEDAIKRETQKIIDTLSK